ncbi:hypothetical protein AB0C34_02620 [Nocardia sp. NPDC049220]|uniref:hypothetical protein n=1 Tax=Nocardia sp. NPDC049220 TaxID=3155273 RepID=UPI00340EF0DD
MPDDAGREPAQRTHDNPHSLATGPTAAAWYPRFAGKSTETSVWTPAHRVRVDDTHSNQRDTPSLRAFAAWRSSPIGLRLDNPPRGV